MFKVLFGIALVALLVGSAHAGDFNEADYLITPEARTDEEALRLATFFYEANIVAKQCPHIRVNTALPDTIIKRVSKPDYDRMVAVGLKAEEGVINTKEAMGRANWCGEMWSEFGPKGSVLTGLIDYDPN